MPTVNKVKWLLRFEGFFYLLTGLWPLFHLPSYIRMTGCNADSWQLATVGALLTLNGFSFLLESRSRMISKSIIALAIAVPVILLWVDVFYVFSGVIAPIYMIDAMVENLILIGWLLIFVTEKISATTA